MYFKTYIDRDFTEILKSAEKEFSKCFSNDLNDRSEDELRQALEKKMAERQKKQTRAEQAKTKLLEVLKDISDVTIDDETTKTTCSFSFTTEKGKGRGILSLEKDNFFT